MCVYKQSIRSGAVCERVFMLKYGRSTTFVNSFVPNALTGPSYAAHDMKSVINRDFIGDAQWHLTLYATLSMVIPQNLQLLYTYVKCCWKQFIPAVSTGIKREIIWRKLIFLNMYLSRQVLSVIDSHKINNWSTSKVHTFSWWIMSARCISTKML